MVIVYHFFASTINPFGRFNIGYIGVDIFLFLSGWGLTYSYTKNNIKTFYIRRIKKIIPLYLLTSIIIIAISINSENINIIEALKRISTISFYIDPNKSIDWYLNSLFIFYLIFPVLYKICNKLKFKTVILFTAIVLTIYYMAWYYHIPIHWKYDCFLGRIPIFCGGIVYATCLYSSKQIKASTLACLLLYLPLYYISHFLAASTLVLPLFLLLSNLKEATSHPIYRKIEYIGRYTLELYCANIITHKLLIELIPNTDLISIIMKGITYIFLQIILSLFLIKCNNSIQRIINHANSIQ